MENTYLQRDIRVEVKFWHFFRPECESLRFRINEVVKNCPLRRKLDGLEFAQPPLAELQTVIHELGGTKRRTTQKLVLVSVALVLSRGMQLWAGGSDEQGGTGRRWVLVLELYLVLEKGPTKGPGTGEDKIELIEVLGRVWWYVLWCQQALEQAQHHLYQRDLGDRGDLLETSLVLL